MSLLAVGISHRTAQLDLLERVALDDAAAARLNESALVREHVGEVVTITTCNRVELYADVATFHGGLSDLGAALADTTGVPLEELTSHLYVHYEDQAVAHLFTVACGLDSMAVGEGQILGQVRQAHRAGAGSDRPAGCWTTCSSRPCGSASGPTRRPLSTRPDGPSSRPGSTTPQRFWGSSDRWPSSTCSSSEPAR